MRHDRPTNRGSGAGFETTRIARRYPRGLGWRIRTNSLLPGKLTPDDYGRDHHPRCFTVWLAGAGVKRGSTIGETDDFSYNITRDPVHVHDLNATILHLLGIDHKKLTFKFQGRHYRLTDVHGNIVQGILS